MARRRQQETLANVLIVLPWWVSIVLGCIAFAIMRWIIPSVFASNPFLIGLSSLSRTGAWLGLLFFGFIGMIAFARAKTAQVPDRHAERNGMRLEPRHAPAVNATLPKLDQAWGSFEKSASEISSGWGVSNQRSIEAVRPPDTFKAWTIDALRALEWKRFELLCAKYYESVGFKSETLRCGADGGIDVKLFKLDPTKPLGIVQCKAWNTYSVGVKEVRELLGVMAHEKVGRGIFLTTGSYTKEALAFGTDNPIQLLDGPGFLAKIQALPQDRQTALFQYAFDGDYRTPTCASCGVKMARRESKRGPFWGCVNYPRCRSTFAMKA